TRFSRDWSSDVCSSDLTKLEHEIRIYQKDFNSVTVPHIHVAPHTLEMAAMWSILTRLEEPKKANLTLMQKLKLYNGKTTQQFTRSEERRVGKDAGEARR